MFSLELVFMSYFKSMIACTSSWCYYVILCENQDTLIIQTFIINANQSEKSHLTPTPYKHTNVIQTLANLSSMTSHLSPTRILAQYDATTVPFLEINKKKSTLFFPESSHHTLVGVFVRQNERDAGMKGLKTALCWETDIAGGWFRSNQVTVCNVWSWLGSLIPLSLLWHMQELWNLGWTASGFRLIFSVFSHASREMSWCRWDLLYIFGG